MVVGGSNDPWEEAAKTYKAPGGAAPAPAPAEGKGKSDPWEAAAKTYRKPGVSKPTKPGVSKPTTQADIDKALGSTSTLSQLSNRIAGGNPFEGVGNALSRSFGTAGNTLASMFNPKTYTEAAGAKETPEEAEMLGPGTMAQSGPAGRLVNRMVTMPVATAAQYYAGDAPNKFENMLSVAPEGFGTAGGVVVGGKLLNTAGNIARAGMRGGATMPERLSAMKAAVPREVVGENIPKAVNAVGRNVVKAVNAVGQNVVNPAIRATGRGLRSPYVAKAIPPAVTAGVGLLAGGPVGAAVGGTLGTGADLFGAAKKIQGVGQHLAEFGLDDPYDVLKSRMVKSPFTQGRLAGKLMTPEARAAYDSGVIKKGMLSTRDIGTESGGKPFEIIDVKGMKQPRLRRTFQKYANELEAKLPDRAAEEQANSIGLTPEELKEYEAAFAKPVGGTPPPATTVAPPEAVKPMEETIPGHTPVKSTAMESYKYDPTTKELQVLRKGAKRGHVYQGVEPDEVKAAEDAIARGESAMRTFQKVENAHTVAGDLDRTGKVTLRNTGGSFGNEKGAVSEDVNFPHRSRNLLTGKGAPKAVEARNVPEPKPEPKAGVGANFDEMAKLDKDIRSGDFSAEQYARWQALHEGRAGAPGPPNPNYHPVGVDLTTTPPHVGLSDADIAEFVKTHPVSGSLAEPKNIPFRDEWENVFADKTEPKPKITGLEGTGSVATPREVENTRLAGENTGKPLTETQAQHGANEFLKNLKPPREYRVLPDEAVTAPYVNPEGPVNAFIRRGRMEAPPPVEAVDTRPQAVGMADQQRLANDALAKHAVANPPAGEMTDQAEYYHQLRKGLGVIPEKTVIEPEEAGPGRDIDLVAKDGSTIGYARVAPNPDVAGEWMMKNVRVEEPARGQGNGTRLYEQAIRQAKENGAMSMRSDPSMMSADAHRMWESLGKKYKVEKFPDPKTGTGYRIKFKG